MQKFFEQEKIDEIFMQLYASSQLCGYLSPREFEAHISAFSILLLDWRSFLFSQRGGLMFRVKWII